MASCPLRGKRLKLWNKKTWRPYLNRAWVNWQHSVGSELWKTLSSSYHTCIFEQCVSTLEQFHSYISKQWKGHQFLHRPSLYIASASNIQVEMRFVELKLREFTESCGCRIIKLKKNNKQNNKTLPTIRWRKLRFVSS